MNCEIPLFLLSLLKPLSLCLSYVDVAVTSVFSGDCVWSLHCLWQVPRFCFVLSSLWWATLLAQVNWKKYHAKVHKWQTWCKRFSRIESSASQFPSKIILFCQVQWMNVSLNHCCITKQKEMYRTFVVVFTWFNRLLYVCLAGDGCWIGQSLDTRSIYAFICKVTQFFFWSLANLTSQFLRH